MRFLHIGISCVFLFSLSCEKEYVVKADFIYVNELDVPISYNQLALDNSDTTELFTIEPNSEKVIRVNGEGDKHPSVNTCCEGFLGDLQGTDFPLLIIFESSQCSRYEEGEGPTTTNISAYESREKSENHFEFIYRFTATDFAMADECN